MKIGRKFFTGKASPRIRLPTVSQLQIFSISSKRRLNLCFLCAAKYSGGRCGWFVSRHSRSLAFWRAFWQDVLSQALGFLVCGRGTKRPPQNSHGHFSSLLVGTFVLCSKLLYRSHIVSASSVMGRQLGSASRLLMGGVFLPKQTQSFKKKVN